MDTISEAPARTAVERAAGLVPVLRAAAERTEQQRRLPEDTVAALADAGLFRLRVPARYGGLESDARTIVEVLTQLGRGDGSTAWTAGVWYIATWMAGMFPDAVQDEVFARPDVRVCGTLSPSATATPAPGGVRISGQWGFISGAGHSHWQVVIAMSGGDQPPQPLLALVPMSDLRTVDDWYTAGLSGSGSITTVAEDVFVPAERVLPLGPALHGRYASERNAASPMYRAPLIPTAAATSVGTVVGLARAAQEHFTERMPERGITYTAYASQADAALTHLRLADAVLLADEAEGHAHRLAALVDTKGAQGEPWTVPDRALTRGLLGRAARNARASVDLLASASGGSSLYRTSAIRRVARDVEAVTLHALISPDTNAELYGRVLCGLEPHTFYL